MIYGVYIIESLDEEDYWDGEGLYQILELTRIKCEYKNVLSKEDFISKISDFEKTDFRYLHLSFHGGEEGVSINGEDVSYDELSRIINPVIKKKRVFISSCRGSNRKLAANLIVRGNCQSLIGCPIDLRFDKAALFWPSFYHVINMVDSKRMDQKIITSTIQKCVDLFRIPINYYHTLPKKPANHIRRVKFRPNKWRDNRVIKIRFK